MLHFCLQSVLPKRDDIYCLVKTNHVPSKRKGNMFCLHLHRVFDLFCWVNKIKCIQHILWNQWLAVTNGKTIT